MGFFVYLETNKGDYIPIKQPSGGPAGDALLSFLVTLWNVCNEKEQNPETKEWFKKLQKDGNQAICKLANVFYSGNWDYSENEYQRYLNESPQIPLSEDDFIATLSQLKEKWISLVVMEEITTTIYKLLTTGGINSDAWYAPEYSIEDFQGLLTKLSEVRRHGVKEVRLHFM